MKCPKCGKYDAGMIDHDVDFDDRIETWECSCGFVWIMMYGINGIDWVDYKAFHSGSDDYVIHKLTEDEQ